MKHRSFPIDASGTESVCQCRRLKRCRFDPWVGKILPGVGNGNTLQNFLAWKIPWAEKSGRLQSMGPQRVRHDWAQPHKHTNEAKFFNRNIFKCFLWILGTLSHQTSFHCWHIFECLGLKSPILMRLRERGIVEEGVLQMWYKISQVLGVLSSALRRKRRLAELKFPSALQCYGCQEASVLY